MIKKLVLGLIIFIVLLVAYNLINQIAQAVKSQERLTSAADIVYKLETENKKLEKKLSAINSLEFIEEHARNELNLGKEGETMVIIPENKLKQVLGASQAANEARFANWLGWWKVFF